MDVSRSGARIAFHAPSVRRGRSLLPPFGELHVLQRVTLACNEMGNHIIAHGHYEGEGLEEFCEFSAFDCLKTARIVGSHINIFDRGHFIFMSWRVRTNRELETERRGR